MVKLPFGKREIVYQPSPEDEILMSAIGNLTARNGAETVRKAMVAPYGGKTLRELARGKENIVLIISDHTRPVPSRDILPSVLEEIREGAPEAKVTLLVATGAHRGTTEEELKGKLGELYGKYPIVIHDARKAEEQVDLGVLPSGARLLIDKVGAEADLLVAEGFIEPHFFAGFSGGRKSILPGICSLTTVMGNHCSRFIADPKARTGILEGNPIHRDMVAAARMAGLAYVVNVIIDGNKKTAAAFAGDPFLAHEAGCRFLTDYCRVSPKEKGDIVISTNGGYPLDQNIYQSVKGLTAAEAAAKENGVLIMVASCDDGHGGESFYKALRDASSPEELYQACLAVPQEKTVADQWEYQILARVMREHRVIYVASPSAKPILEAMHIDYASTLEEALAKAEGMSEGKHRVWIPDGVSVAVV